ncbi:hypothetical protein HPP92_021072 [Vanilla planifolia]|uniref:Uncharacterized protein n=1 Tax=Vanilla planifolia TaxID=51239 RepID=A0A835UKD2_VANPL|nr:hypothetical protein HPP92_021072 [Vanilla planifolia]
MESTRAVVYLIFRRTTRATGDRGGEEDPQRCQSRRCESDKCGESNADGQITWSSPLVKQKQKGVDRMLLPSVEGHGGGKWVVIDSGTVIIHALDEKARAYYNLESLWTNEMIDKETSQDLEKAFVKVRPKNNSKRKPGKITK